MVYNYPNLGMQQRNWMSISEIRSFLVELEGIGILYFHGYVQVV